MSQSLGAFQLNYVNPITGRSIQYEPVSVAEREIDGVQTVRLPDGLTYRDVNALGKRKWVNVRELGLKGDGTFNNSPVLRAAMERLPKCTDFFFPEGNYYFEPLPLKYNCFGTPVAIYLGDSGANLYGESAEATRFSIAANCIGIQITGGQAPGITKLKDFSIYGPGQFAPTNHPAGSTDFKYNLINGWGQFHLNSVNVSSAADGHGICVYGDPEVYLPLPTIESRGVVRPFPDGTPGFIFRADDPATLSEQFQGVPVVFNGKAYRCNNYADGNAEMFCIEPHSSYPAPGTYTIEIKITRGALIADNSLLDGIWNSDFNTGCGIFLVGADGNQTNIIGGSVRENGDWGIKDQSFLGTFIYGTHGSRNGKATNRLGIDNIFGNDSLTVGSFAVTSQTAASVWVGAYSEQGNQGQDYLGAASVSIAGLHGNGVTGPGLHIESRNLNKLTITEAFDFRDRVLHIYHRATPDILVTGTFSSTTRNGATEILFTPQDTAQVGLATVGQTFAAYGNPKAITSILPGQGWTLGPLTPFYPPSSPTTTPVTGALITPKVHTQTPLELKEFTKEVIGFGRGNTVYLGITPQGIQTPSLRIGDVSQEYAGSLQEYLASRPAGSSVRPGTLVKINRSVGPTTYRCIRGGTFATMPAGITATASGTNLNCSTPPPQDLGYFYEYGGNTYEMVGYTGAQGLLFVSPRPVDAGQQPLRFATPEFTPEGFGRGTLAQRPDGAVLGAVDAGWRYFTTDTTTWYTWTGTAWV